MISSSERYFPITFSIDCLQNKLMSKRCIKATGIDNFIIDNQIPNMHLGVFITDNNDVERASEGVLDDGLEQF